MHRCLWIVGKYGLVSTALQKQCDQLGIQYEASSADEVDITNKKDLYGFCENKKFTHLINCAAYTAVDQAENEKERAYQINALGPEILGKLCLEKKIKCIHLSTDYVFDGTQKTPYKETDLPHPINWYGKTKLEGERKLFLVNEEALVIRTSWIFSQTGHHFLRAIINKALKETTLTVADDQIGKPTYVNDLAEAILNCLEAQGLYHFSNAHGVSRYDYAKVIIQNLKECGAQIRCEHLERGKTKHAPGIALRPSCSVLSTEKIEKLLSQPIRGFEEGVKECITAIYFKELKDVS